MDNLSLFIVVVSLLTGLLSWRFERKSGCCASQWALQRVRRRVR